MKTVRAIIKLILLLASWLVLFCFDLLILILFHPFSKITSRRISTFCGPFWGKLLVKILGIWVNVKGIENYEREQNYCLISNHMSYLDILILAAVFPTIFVSRHDVKYWPLLGTIAWIRGAIFVDRTITGAQQKPHIKKIIEYLQNGLNVLVFPEGKTSNGESLLPFKKTIFSCPVKAGTAILPITIRYAFINGEPFTEQNRDRVCWYGGMTFLDHIWNVLKLRKFEVIVAIRPPVFESAAEDWLEQARNLSVKIHDIIEKGYLEL
jgi:1-acyl-sn-glycerol-3-phosphate acyltransferase